MPDFGVNLSRFERKIQKNSKKINKNLNDLKLKFLELAHLGLYSGKVWENRFFRYCMTKSNRVLVSKAPPPFIRSPIGQK